MCTPCSFRPGQGPRKTPLRSRLMGFALTSLFEEDDPDYDPTQDEDNRMTCIYCGRDKCDLGIVGFGNGKTMMYGIHEECLAKHESRTRKYLAREVGEW